MFLPLLLCFMLRVTPSLLYSTTSSKELLLGSYSSLQIQENPPDHDANFQPALAQHSFSISDHSASIMRNGITSLKHREVDNGCLLLDVPGECCNERECSLLSNCKKSEDSCSFDPRTWSSVSTKACRNCKCGLAQGNAHKRKKEVEDDDTPARAGVGHRAFIETGCIILRHNCMSRCDPRECASKDVVCVKRIGGCTDQSSFRDHPACAECTCQISPSFPKRRISKPWKRLEAERRTKAWERILHLRNESKDELHEYRRGRVGTSCYV